MRTTTDQVEAKSIFDLLPSWLVSVAVHAALFFGFAMALRGCQGQLDTGGADSGDRIVGLYVKSENNRPVVSQAEQSASVDPVSAEQVHSPTAPPETSEFSEPPIETNLPRLNANVLGAGALPQTVNPGSVNELMNVDSTARSAAASEFGSGETSMFGIRDTGRRFVYVIDSSGSMYGEPFMVAKGELLASLQGLDRNQDFGVIFYNKSISVLRLRGDTEYRLYKATDFNRSAARDFVYREQSRAGTNHMLALRTALRLNPDVIYFLTDAKQPVLRTADLADIDQLNQGRCRIHCIEFGSGPELGLDNFLKKLARQNGGRFQYRDVTRFQATGR